MTPAFHPHGDLEANLTAFCEVLRTEHGFRVGPGEAIDALRAAEAVGIDDLTQVKAALRLVLTSKLEETEPFDQAFDQFFFPPQRPGVKQHHYQPRHSRPDQKPDKPRNERKTDERPQPTGSGEESDEELEGAAQKREVLEENPDAAETWRVMQARYSVLAAEGEPPEIPQEGFPEMLRAASQLLKRLRLGQSRRWKPMPRGARFDFRRTLRAGVASGEAFHFHWLGHPRRNPRIVVIVDGSRSMSEYGGLMLQFAYALLQRTRRLDAFVFSTRLHDITKKLRQIQSLPPSRGGITDLAEAWGGGTRIGECLESFVHDYGSRCLSDDTLVLILSDGLDVGEPQRLEKAMREVRRRSAGIVWLNPLLGTPGYEPSAKGMQAALPYVSHFASGHDRQAFQRLGLALKLAR